MKCGSSTPNAMALENKQLSLFGSADEGLDASSPAGRPGPSAALPQPSHQPAPPQNNTPGAHAPGAASSPHTATKQALVLTPPPSLPHGARWREVQTPKQTIGFVLRRSRRKSIGLAVNDDGLLVTAPTWATLGQIDSAVREKTRWILEKLHQLHERRQHLAMADTQWNDGTRIPYLGHRIELRLGHAGQAHSFTGSLHHPQDGDLLHLALPRSADHQRVRDSVHAWLQARATDWFGQRLEHFLSVNGLAINRWRLSSAGTRWGSCSSDGNIMLNWRLVHFAPDIIDYVVVHEIAHLRQMNHSAAFWQEVERMLPGFESARNALRRHDPASLPLI